MGEVSDGGFGWVRVKFISSPPQPVTKSCVNEDVLIKHWCRRVEQERGPTIQINTTSQCLICTGV